MFVSIVICKYEWEMRLTIILEVALDVQMAEVDAELREVVHELAELDVILEVMITEACNAVTLNDVYQFLMLRELFVDHANGIAEMFGLFWVAT